jgi:hypothetical protein
LSRALALATLASVVALTACFNPTFNNPTCGPGGECPDGMTCAADNICRVGGDGVDGAIDSPIDSDVDSPIDAPSDGIVDSPIDGPPVDGPPIDSGPVCGNGVIEGSEVCDDHNTSACGTCTANCDNVVPPRAATGTIQEIVGMQHNEGETLTLNDGFNTPTVFEYSFDATVSGGRVGIFIQTGDGMGQVATKTMNAINGVGTTLEISAPQQSSGLVSLTHDRQYSFGNQPITETVVSNTYVTTGMSGGAAGDCPSFTGCNQNADCISGSCNVATFACF